MSLLFAIPDPWQHQFVINMIFTALFITHIRQGYGTALGLITYLHETGKLNKAYYTQTAPYHQGSRQVGS